MFSVTLSVPAGCCPQDPRLTRGTVPWGVRTFLPRSAYADWGRLPDYVFSASAVTTLVMQMPVKLDLDRMFRINPTVCELIGFSVPFAGNVDKPAPQTGLRDDPAGILNKLLQPRFFDLVRSLHLPDQQFAIGMNNQVRAI